MAAHGGVNGRGAATEHKKEIETLGGNGEDSNNL